MNSKKKITLLMILTLIFMLVGGTFAYWNWQSTSGQKTNVVFTVAQGFSCGADGGGNITSSDVTLAPATCTNPAYAIQRELKVSTTQDAGKEISLDIWLKVNNISSALAQTENFKYALTISSESCTDGVIADGNFNGATTGSELPLITDKVYTESVSNDTYYLYIWLDAAETDRNTMNQTFDISVGGLCEDDLPEAQLYEITLDNANATINGTNKVYLKYNYGIYLDNNYSNKMTSNSNNITIPQRTNFVFDGYYDGNTKMIDESGYITSSFISTKYNEDKTLNARWIAGSGVPVPGAKFVSNDSSYTSGTWTKDSVYLDLSIVSEEKVITKFQYSLNAGSTWNDLACTKSSGITHNDNTYGCQQVWTTTGNNSITIRAIDNENNPSTASDALNLRYDTEAPTASIDTDVMDTTITAILNAEDSLSGINEDHYYFKVLSTDTCGVGTEGTTGFIDNEDSNEYVFNANTNTDYYICGKVFDKAGNEVYISTQENISNKVYLKLFEENRDFKVTKYRDRIKKVQVVNYIDLSNSVNSWNLANDGSDSIKGWINSNTVNASNYDLYIGSNSHIYATNMYQMFNNMRAVAEMDLSGLYTKEVTNMSYAFYFVGQDANSVNLNLGNQFDTSNVTNMTSMFSMVAGSSNEFNINLGNKFDTSNVNDMVYMFSGLGQSATNWSINLGDKFDTSNVTSMYMMFGFAGNYSENVSLDLGNNFNACNVTNMSWMFQFFGSNSRHFSLNLGNNFNSVNVDDMSYMLYHAGENATDWHFDLGNNFDTSNVTTMYEMFENFGVNATDWNVSFGEKFDASKVINFTRMFGNVGAYSVDVNLNLGNNFNVSKVLDASYVFQGVGREATNVNINLGNNFNVSNAYTTQYMFYQTGIDAESVNIDLGNNFNAGNVKTTQYMFYSVGQNATDFNLNMGNNFNAAQVQNIIYMFHQAGEKATNWNLDIGNNFDTSNVIGAEWMFHQAGTNASNITLNLSKGFNTHNLIRTTGMFYNFGASSNNFSLDLGPNFDTSNVTDMGSMFYNTGANATNFYISLGNHFNTSKVTVLSNAFYNLGRNAQNSFILDLSVGNFSNVTASGNVFNSPLAMIYVSDPDSQNWIIDKNDVWGTNFNVNNVIINNINYVLDGGSFGSTPLYTMKGRSESYTLPMPIKSGYTFLGWVGSNGNSPETTVVIPAGTTEILRYTAVWSGGASIPTYTVKYVSNDSSYNGVWTKESIYVELSTISPTATINAFQYSLNGGRTWNSVTCDKSNGITNNGTEYKCQVTWAINGDNSVVFRASDSNDVVTSISSPLNIKYDTDVPTGELIVTITGQMVTAELLASDSLSGVLEDYYYKLLTTDTCDSETTGFIDNDDNNIYSFNANEETNYYICSMFYDNVGNMKRISKIVNISSKVYLKTLGSEFQPYRNKIRRIETVNYINLTNSIANWDLSNDSSNSIKGWIVNNTIVSNDYDLYIGSEYQMYATNLYNAFASMGNVSNINLSVLNTFGLTNVENAFKSTGGYNVNSWNVNLGNDFDTSQVRSMRGMFENAGYEAKDWKLDLGSKFNTSNVNNMMNMFMSLGKNSTNFNLNLGDNFDTSSVLDMSYMFFKGGCWPSSFNLGDKFNTVNVTNMTSMYSKLCTNTTNWSLNLGPNFDTSNVLYMNEMFAEAGSNATNWQLHLDFNANRVRNMANMFSNVGYKASNFDLSLGDNFNSINVNNMSRMFYNAGLSAKNWQLNLGSNFNAIKVVNTSYMFDGAGKDATDWSLNLGDEFYAASLKYAARMFSSAGANAINWSLDLGNNFNGNVLINASYMFAGAGAIATNWHLNFGDNFNVGYYLTNVQYMFSGAGKSATEWNLNLGNNFNTYKVTNMVGMFDSVGKNATNFDLNLGNKFITSNVNNMASMFNAAGQNAINWSLDLGNNFNTYKVVSMANMFKETALLNTQFALNLGDKFVMSNVTNASNMFSEMGFSAQNPFTVDLSAGNFNKISNHMSMFNYFGNGKATIYVKDATAQDWIINNTSNWAGTNFNSSNVLIK